MNSTRSDRAIGFEFSAYHLCTNGMERARDFRYSCYYCTYGLQYSVYCSSSTDIRTGLTDRLQTQTLSGARTARAEVLSELV